MADLKVSFPSPCSEPWEDMAPQGCNRHCAACDKLIHDLSALTADEAEALLEAEEEVCVRARVGRDGVIALRDGGRKTARRIVAVMSGSLALATAACQTVPDTREPRYQITGKFDWKGYYYAAELTSADGRKWPKRREPGTGRFIFDNLVPGVYTLTTDGYCGARQVVDTITITDASVEVSKGTPPIDQNCIIVGVMVPAERRFRG